MSQVGRHLRRNYNLHARQTKLNCCSGRRQGYTYTDELALRGKKDDAASLTVVVAPFILLISATLAAAATMALGCVHCSWLASGPLLRHLYPNFGNPFATANPRTPAVGGSPPADP